MTESCCCPVCVWRSAARNELTLRHHCWRRRKMVDQTRATMVGGLTPDGQNKFGIPSVRDINYRG